MSETAPGFARRYLVVPGLGVTQILTWGSSYYLLAVLAPVIARDTGWLLSWVVGGLSLGMLVAGTSSPLIGRLIQKHGGRPVLCASSVLIAIGLCTIAFATTRTVYVGGWLVTGLGMGAGLYDAAFATLGRLYGAGARKAITNLTLFGGFASTVCWPLSAFLVDACGWRNTCLIYAGIQLAICLPINLFLIPRAPPPTAAESVRPTDAGVSSYGPAFVLLALILSCTAVTTSLISVHLLTLLQARGFELTGAVALGALIGPSQVAARLVEWSFGPRYHPMWTMLASVALIATGMSMLLVDAPLALVALILYGAGNGIGSIARGTLPLAVFGADNYPIIMGRLAMPSLIAQAAAPSIGALLIEFGGAGLTMSALAILASTNCAIALVLARRVWRPASG
ncbi:MFS transporter [Roseiarcaceae bacterium H3SJ34-1]|uniref:MFS transporter n=1 Tax=Terripilifer ovatus TaxID=3032367 RepID=UPI003AB92A61|nr:MFS transporter [Roseiarcaceae bacterium H3SJ34-1]